MKIKATNLTEIGANEVVQLLPDASNKTKVSTIYCPRCQRGYNRKKGESYTDILNRVKDHVSLQHPDHDPEWADTYPDPE